jgi:hypothetical protein
MTPYQLKRNKIAATVNAMSFIIAPFYSDGQFSFTQPSAQAFFLGHSEQLFARTTDFPKMPVKKARRESSATSTKPLVSGQVRIFLYRKRRYRASV